MADSSVTRSSAEGDWVNPIEIVAGAMPPSSFDRLLTAASIVHALETAGFHLVHHEQIPDRMLSASMSALGLGEHSVWITTKEKHKVRLREAIKAAPRFAYSVLASAIARRARGYADIVSEKQVAEILRLRGGGDGK